MGSEPATYCELHFGQKEIYGLQQHPGDSVSCVGFTAYCMLAEPVLVRYSPATDHNAARAADCRLFSIHLKPKHSHF